MPSRREHPCQSASQVPLHRQGAPRPEGHVACPGCQHFNCLVNGAQNIIIIIFLWCLEPNVLMMMTRRKTKNIFFLEKVEINECFGLLSAHVSAEQTLLTMCYDDD